MDDPYTAYAAYLFFVAAVLTLVMLARQVRRLADWITDRLVDAIEAEEARSRQPLDTSETIW